MKAIILFLFILSSFTFKTFSQPDSIRGEFLYLFSGELIKARTITYNKPIFGASYFEANNMRFNLEKVKYVNFDEGFFANYYLPGYSYTTKWAKCFSSGKFNFFENTQITVSNSGTAGMIRNFYYSQGLDDLKKAKYRFLKVDLADNQESMKYLNTFKKLTIAEISTYVVASGLIVGGIVKNMNASFDEGHEMDGIPMLITGCVFYSANALGITIFLKPHLLKKAAKAYNGD